jgi:uncharacterized protein (DUF486 family)
MKGFMTIGLLVLSNVFMTLAWYGHLYLKKSSPIMKWGLFGIIVFSWGLALFEYVFQVPANRIGHESNGGPFSLIQLKVIQEVISLTVFAILSVLVFRSEKFDWNHAAAFVCLVLAVWFTFRK